MTIDEIKERAAAVGSEMQAGEVTPELRARFIDVRTALFRRGVYDPVLVRFDSSTAPRATKDEIAAQLETVAQTLV